MYKIKTDSLFKRAISKSIDNKVKIIGCILCYIINFFAVIFVYSDSLITVDVQLIGVHT